jgi:hypothetical protein
LKLFAPEPDRTKTVLLFVIRDKSKTPMDKIREILLEDLTGIWRTMSKPPQYTESNVLDFFEVQVGGLVGQSAFRAGACGDCRLRLLT